MECVGIVFQEQRYRMQKLSDDLTALTQKVTKLEASSRLEKQKIATQESEQQELFSLLSNQQLMGKVKQLETRMKDVEQLSPNFTSNQQLLEKCTHFETRMKDVEERFNLEVFRVALPGYQ